MRNERQAIQLVINTKIKKGNDYPTVTNERLINERATNIKERKGIDVIASQLRQRINPFLEQEHGIGLIPFDYNSTCAIVPIDERAAYMIRLSAVRMSNAAVEMAKRIEEYATNPYISTAGTTSLIAMDKVMTAIEALHETALQPQLHKLEAMLEKLESAGLKQVASAGKK